MTDEIIPQIKMTTTKPKAFNVLASQQWAMVPEMLETMSQIAERENDIDAVLAKRGKPLENTRTVSMRGSTAIIPISGPIFRYANLFTQVSGATSVEMLAKDFNEALENPEVESIVLDIDSPGGMVNGTGEFAEMVKAADKPVIAYTGGMMASAAYWIGSAADRVIASKTAEIGSIGTVATINTSKDKDTMEIVSSQSPNKRMDPTTDEGRAKIQATVDDLAAVFIETVAENRGVSVETVLSDFGKGGMMVGAKALQAGLVDEIATLETVIAGLAGENQSRGANVMAEAENTPALTLDILKAEHADLFEQAMAIGAQKERERIQGVEDQLIAGHEELIASLKFDGKTTGEQAAVQILRAEKEARGNSLQALKAEAAQPVAEPVTDNAEDISSEDYDHLPLDKRCEKIWNTSASVREEFMNDFDSFYAFEKASESGSIKILGK